MQANHLKAVSDRIEVIKSTIDKLLSLQLPSGNFPSSLESCSRDKLVQWCHGAPGFVHMLEMAYKVKLKLLPQLHYAIVFLGFSR